MNSNPLSNRQLTHEEAIRRFLEQVNADLQPKQQQPQPKQHQPQPQQPQPQQPQPQPPQIRLLTTDQMVTQEAAEELARWFEK